MSNQSPSGLPAPIEICRLVRHRVRRYDREFLEAMTVVWQASGRVCGKRLEALAEVLVPSLERHGHLRPDPLVRSKLLSVSAATIDRLLSEERTVRGLRTMDNPSPFRFRRPSRIAPALWPNPIPGYLWIEVHAHAGRGQHPGGCLHTVHATDLYSGWRESAPLAVCEPHELIRCLEEIRSALPFRLLGIAADLEREAAPGYAELERALVRYCAEGTLEWSGPGGAGNEAAAGGPKSAGDGAAASARPNGVAVTRSRATVVDVVGPLRLEEAAAAEVLSELYAVSRLHLNFFHCAFALREKSRIGTRLVKRYAELAPPCARLLASEALTGEEKSRLSGELDTLDPLSLLAQMRALQLRLAEFAAAYGALRDRGAEQASVSAQVPVSAQAPTGPRANAVQKLRYWRTHTDAFEPVRATIQAWLESDPSQSTQVLFKRLRREFPRAFRETQLRTLQRRVRKWRAQPG